MLMELPLIQEALQKQTAKHIQTVIRHRFGDIPEELSHKLEAIEDDKQLLELLCNAVTCGSLESFEHDLDQP